MHHCAALSNAALVVVVVSLLSLPPLSLLLPSSSVLLSSSSSRHTPSPLLPLPPITAFTRSPQSSTATLPSYIATTVELCLHCPLCPPWPSSIAAAVKRPHPLSQPPAAAVECHLCWCHLATTVERHQTLSTDQIPARRGRLRRRR